MKIELRQQTCYSLLNKCLRYENFNNAAIVYGRAILQKKFLIAPKNVNAQKFYICIKANTDVAPKNAIYDGVRSLNSVIGWGADQLHIDIADIIDIAETSNMKYYFVELS